MTSQVSNFEGRELDAEDGDTMQGFDAESCRYCIEMPPHGYLYFNASPAPSIVLRPLDLCGIFLHSAAYTMMGRNESMDCSAVI